MLRQKTMHMLNMDTQEVDFEIKQLRKSLSNSPFIGSIPKFTIATKKIPINPLSLPKAYAFEYAHNNERDDSRGKYSDDWIRVYADLSIFSFNLLNFQLLTWLINAAEVIYNEARGMSQVGRYAVAWAIRNRATIDMNGCNFYPGAESHPAVNVCRKLTSAGPSGKGSSSDMFKRYSCVVHGGTVDLGSTHSEMNDTHVDVDKLMDSGIIWDIVTVSNGWAPEQFGSKYYYVSHYPDRNYFSGNPDGAQEWKSQNYCTENHSCKMRLGNIGANISVPENSCKRSTSISTDISAGDFFGGVSRTILYLILLIK